MRLLLQQERKDAGASKRAETSAPWSPQNFSEVGKVTKCLEKVDFGFILWGFCVYGATNESAVHIVQIDMVGLGQPVVYLTDKELGKNINK